MGGDPFEMGSSRPLDFGHWAAHKLEQLSHFTISHSAAVAIGLWLDVRYSVKAGLLAEAEARRIDAVLKTMAMPRFDEHLLQRDDHGSLAVLAGLEEFREHLGGRLTVLLLEAPGKGIDVHEMKPAWISECIEELHAQTLLAAHA
jgi:3-dehydroquinate synthase